MNETQVLGSDGPVLENGRRLFDDIVALFRAASTLSDFPEENTKQRATIYNVGLELSVNMFSAFVAQRRSVLEMASAEFKAVPSFKDPKDRLNVTLRGVSPGFFEEFLDDLAKDGASLHVLRPKRICFYDTVKLARRKKYVLLTLPPNVGGLEDEYELQKEDFETRRTPALERDRHYREYGGSTSVRRLSIHGRDLVVITRS